MAGAFVLPLGHRLLPPAEKITGRKAARRRAHYKASGKRPESVRFRKDRSQRKGGSAVRIPCEDPIRRRLAETAARRAAAGQDSAPVLAGLRRLNLRLLLAPAPARRAARRTWPGRRMPCAQPHRRRRGGGPGGCTPCCPPNAVWPVRAHGALIRRRCWPRCAGCWHRAGRACCAAPNRAARCGCVSRAARRVPAPPLYGGGWRRNAAARPCSAQGACSRRPPAAAVRGRSGRRARRARGAVRPVFAAVPVFWRMGRAAVARAARPRRNAQKNAPKSRRIWPDVIFFDFRC